MGEPIAVEAFEFGLLANAWLNLTGLTDLVVY
jgi:hypothetical protein